MRVHDHLFIDGDWVAPAAARTLDVVNPHSEEVIARVAEAREADVDRAVAAARARVRRGPVAAHYGRPSARTSWSGSSARSQARSDELADDHHAGDGLADLVLPHGPGDGRRTWCSTTTRGSRASTRSRRSAPACSARASSAASRSASSARSSRGTCRCSSPC